MNRITFLFLFILFKTGAQTSVLNSADSLYVNGNYSQAIEQYKKYENQSEVYNKIAKSYIAIGNYDLALKNYRSSIENNLEDALVKFEYARLLLKTKNFDLAYKSFNELIVIDGNNPNYYYELGLVLEHLKDSTNQIAFNKTYQLDSTHQKAIFKVAKYNLKKGRFSKVQQLAGEGLRTYPNNVQLISLIAQSYYWQENNHKAIAWFEKLLALNESSEFIYEKLSILCSKTFQYEKAIVYAEKALQYSPSNTTYLAMLGQLYERVDNFPKAEKYMKALLALQDVSLEKEYERLGMVLNRQKKHKEALKAFKNAVRENPMSESAHFFVVFTKDQYYKDIETRINAYETFKEKFPETEFLNMVNYRITELKKEKFLKTD